MKIQSEDTYHSLRQVIAESDIPLITGNSQDIIWAKEIRIELLLGVNQWIARLQNQVSLGEVPSAQLEKTILASRRLRDITPAVWWIACRNRNLGVLLSELVDPSYRLESGGNG